MRLLIAAVVVALAFVACADEPDITDDVEAVVEAMEEEDIECEDLETTDEFGKESDAVVVERGLCLVGEDRVVISTFENADDRDEWVEVSKLFGKVAVGDHWAVGSDSEALVEEIADALDASIPRGQEG